MLPRNRVRKMMKDPANTHAGKLCLTVEQATRMIEDAEDEMVDAAQKVVLAEAARMRATYERTGDITSRIWSAGVDLASQRITDLQHKGKRVLKAARSRLRRSRKPEA